MAATPPSASSSTLYVTAAGIIDQAFLQRVFQGFAMASNANVQQIHLLFQSTGGTVADGIALYNYLRTLPIELHLYNAGTVSSIAVIVVLELSIAMLPQTQPS